MGCVFFTQLTSFFKEFTSKGISRFFLWDGHPARLCIGFRCVIAYPIGLEVKCTIGNITQGKNLRVGQTRISVLTGITWQAHHREVRQLLGLVWDFLENTHEFNYPKITGVFYSNNLEVEDWGKISGTTGRNTKVTGMNSSGRSKMGKGWVVLLEKPEYLQKYQKLLSFTIN